MSYEEITDAESSAGAPVTESLAVRLRDNPLSVVAGTAGFGIDASALGPVCVRGNNIDDGAATRDKIASNAATEGKFGSDVIGHVALHYAVSLHSVDLSPGESANQQMSGVGVHGWMPQIKADGIGVAADIVIDGVGSSSQTRIGVRNTDTGSGDFGFADIRMNYITASPPYDLGDGDVPAFVYLLIRTDESIKAVSASIDPPWLNLETPTAPHFYSEGIGYRLGRKPWEVIEVSRAYKNTDMHLMPHPFDEVPAGWHVVIVDPVSDFCQRVCDDLRSGNGDMLRGFRDGRFTLGKKALKRHTPPGVKAVTVKE